MESDELASDPLFLAALDEANAELSGRTAATRRGRPVRSSKRDAVGWLREDLSPAPEGLAAQRLNEERLATLRLRMVPGLGPRLLANLLQHFGSAAEAIRADTEALCRVTGIHVKTASSIKLSRDHRELDELVHWCQHHDTAICFRGEDHYPQPLEDLDDPPPVLFIRGDYLASDGLAVAIVGTRHATSYGLTQAHRLGDALARAGVTVVSGLARGIDAAAHEGALAGGGRTIAVLGGGLAKMYPPEHGGLAKAIAADGCVMSEQPPMVAARSGLFPPRNRLVAALSSATLVVEAPPRSGSLITARLAGELNRDVMAVPGPVSSRVSRGCHELIRDGGTLVGHVDDILEMIGPLAAPVQQPDGREVRHGGELKLNEVERQVLDCVAVDNQPIDAVIAASGLPAHRVMSVISVLEMRRLIRRSGGGYVCRI